MADGVQRSIEHSQPRLIGVIVAIALATATSAGCTRASTGNAQVPPTYIPQPTPDPTMSAVIQGNGLPVSYFPPLDMRASPTPVPAAARPGGASAPRPAAKPAQSAPALPREAPAVREAPPAPRPTAVREPAPAPRPTLAPTRAPATNSSRSTPSSGAPAIINPNTVLPGGARPNPTPAR